MFPCDGTRIAKDGALSSVEKKGKLCRSMLFVTAYLILVAGLIATQRIDGVKPYESNALGWKWTRSLIFQAQGFPHVVLTD